MTAEAPQSSNTAAMLALTGRTARLVLLLYITCQATLAVTGGGDPMRTWQGVLAFVMVMGISVLTVTPDRYPIRLSWTAAIVVVVVASSALIVWQLRTDGSWPGYSAWYIGANTFLLLALGLRGRYIWAWVGMAAMVATTVAWSVTTGQGPWHGASLVIKEAGLLAIGTFFAIGLGRTARRIQALQRAETATIAQAHAEQARAGERDRQLERLQSIAVPVLEKIASQGASTPVERTGYLALEGALRDGIRARTLAVEPLVSAALAARSRGVEVLLLDDLGDHPVQDAEARYAANWVAGILEATHCGTFTARVSWEAGEAVVTAVSATSRHRISLPQ